MGDDLFVLRRHNIQLLFVAHILALHDDRKSFLSRASAHDQSGFAATSLQRVGEQAAYRPRAQDMPVRFTHSQNLRRGIENWSQRITM